MNNEDGLFNLIIPIVALFTIIIGGFFSLLYCRKSIRKTFSSKKSHDIIHQMKDLRDSGQISQNEYLKAVKKFQKNTY